MMKGKITILIAVLITAALFFGCDGSTGNVTLSLTDAPLDDGSIKAVYITVEGIGYQTGTDEDGDWVDEYFDEAKTFDLLELTGGESELLGEFILPAGQINQLRFYLQEQETGSGTPASPGCYLLLKGDTESEEDYTEEELFVPSGGTSGFKAVGSFTVPVNGSVEITADFDARKSVRVTGSGNNSSYKLQPTIRLIVNSQAGTITGSVTYTGENTPVVYVYGEDEPYSVDELIAEGEDPAFPNAVSSFSIIDPDPEDETDELAYTLAFLAEGTYTLVFAELDADGNYIADSVQLLEGVDVTSDAVTDQPFDYAAAAAAAE